MQNSISTPIRRVRSFRQVTKHIQWKGRANRRSLMKEKQDYPTLETDKATDLGYAILSVPKDVTQQEKIKRLSLLVDTVMDVEGSDVLCMVMWVPR